MTFTEVHGRLAQLGLEFGHLQAGIRSLGVAGSATFDNINGGGPVATVACTLEGGAETFDDSVLGESYTGYESDCARAVSSGIMRWTLSSVPGVVPDCGIDSKWRIDLRGASFGAEISSYPTLGTGDYMDMAVRVAAPEAGRTCRDSTRSTKRFRAK